MKNLIPKNKATCKNFLEIIDFLHRAETYSTCAAKKIGAVIFLETKFNNYYVLSYGYNDSIHKIKCNIKYEKKYNHLWYNKITHKPCLNQKEHHNWSLHNEAHAEMMAVINLNFLNFDLYTLHIQNMLVENTLSIICTYSPCINCAKYLVYANIKKVYYIYPYDDIKETKKLFDICNVSLIKISESGEVLNE